MIKPKALKHGATIGVVSPASPSETPFEVIRAKEYLEEKGYKVVIGKNVNKTKGFTAASEEERAADINEMFEREDIDAVWVTQGGYGSAQIIDKLDYEMIKKHPKIFCGFSDITSLHLAFNKYCDMVTFHGPGMARFNDEDLTDYTKEQYYKATDGKAEIGEIKLADSKKWLWSLGKGSVEAPVIGGNLTLITGSLGTPYEIDCKGKILFFEDVDTEPWIMDHQLSHMRNAGKLDDCAGVLIGECFNCKPFDYKPGYLCDTSIEDVISYYLKPLGKPVLYGLPLGHTDDLATLPMGVMCRLDADNKSFTVLEKGVSCE